MTVRDIEKILREEGHQDAVVHEDSGNVRITSPYTIPDRIKEHINLLAPVGMRVIYSKMEKGVPVPVALRKWFVTTGKELKHGKN